ncbi:hypothetical protein AX14_001869 [Amanita brunnescens Koide BX004]|nr:hypothetical protein AX14_001869 [Amanita brunnescens Koide BX004]
MLCLASCLASPFLRSFKAQARHGYTLLGRLDGHSGAVNCLSFTRDGMLLASSGDDEAVRIWDIEALAPLQVIRDPDGNWGQITCVNWLGGSAEERNMLCFGTGRGFVAIFQASGNSTEMGEASIMRAFDWGDSTEAMAFEPAIKRLLVSSHYGKIRMYSVEANGNLSASWESSMRDEIPRSLLFLENSRDAAVFGLEKGSVVYLSADTGAEKSIQSLRPGIGNAIICPKGRNVVVDNLTEGFDIYSTNRMVIVR